MLCVSPGLNSVDESALFALPITLAEFDLVRAIVDYKISINLVTLDIAVFVRWFNGYCHEFIICIESIIVIIVIGIDIIIILS